MFSLYMYTWSLALLWLNESGSLSSDARQPEVSLFLFLNALTIQICIAKWLYSYRDDFPKNLFKIVAQDCKKSTSVRLASLTNVGAYKLPNEESLAAAFRNSRLNRQNTGARI